MNEYIGKTCPYCQSVIKPDIPVIICPQCKTPHHKECWVENENKCTIYGCVGKTYQDTQRSPYSRPQRPYNPPAGYSSGSGGCFVATAVFGDYNAEEVKYLRYLRDRYILKSVVGVFLVKIYYRTGPFFAGFIKEKQYLKKGVKNILRICIIILKLLID